MLNWFKQWTFLHYDEAKELVYCYTCLLCFKEKRLRSANADPAFVSSLNICYGLQERLNYLMLLHVHSDKTDKLDLKSILSDFVQDSVDKIFFHQFIHSDY